MSIENLSKMLNGLGIRRLNVYGDVMKGVCPFHSGSSGKTFWLHPETGRWGCWSTRCSKHSGGGLLDLAHALGASEHQKFLLKDYVKNIASTSSHTRSSSTSPDSACSIRDLDEAGTLRESHVIGWRVNWKDDLYKNQQDFIHARSIPLDLLDFFDVGFCKISESLIFPLRDPDGALLGICRRKPVAGERYYFSGSPYPNSHPNYRYSRVEKTRCLWGFSEQIEDIEELRPIVVVEGFFDVLRLRSYGVVAVAKLGSRLTETQSEVLCGVSNPIVLWPDADKAGVSGVAEDISRLLLHPDVRCVIPKTPDPGETERADASDALGSAVSGPEFLSRITEIMYS